MLGSWFASKPDDEKITDPSRRSAEAPAGTNPFQSSTVDPADPTIEPLRRSITAALSTPHDAVLAELHGHYPDLETSARIDGDDVPGLLTHDAGDGNNVNVNEYAGHGPSSGLARLPHSFLTNFAEAKAGEEILHDPFEGKSLGTLVPPNPILRPEAHTNLSEAARKNEELWTHLSRVLELQSKVATMHVEMEGIRGRPGEGKGKGGLKTGRSWEEGMGMGVRSRATSMAGGGGGEDEGVGVEGDEEAEKNKAREEEFANLAEKFEGTKDSINDIMSTLDDLSKALTNFHALQAPRIEFSNSRHNSLNHNSEIPTNMATNKPAPFSSSTLPSAGPSVIIPMSVSRSEPPPTTTASLIVSSPESWTQAAVVDTPKSTTEIVLPPEG